MSVPQLGSEIRDHRAEDQPVLPELRPLVPILPEGEAIVQPPMDNTPGEAPGSDAPARIPNLGHALLFLTIAVAMLILGQAIFFSVYHAAGKSAADETIPPGFSLAIEAFTYLVTLAISWALFPLLWRKPFSVGIQLNAPAAGRNALRLIPIGITVSFVVLAISSLITMPKSVPMDRFFQTPLDVWLMTAFGILLAPFFEETLFRGFLLPAFAIAYDWLSLPRLPAAREQWNSSNKLTLSAFTFSAVLTSILFALLHGQQNGYSRPVMLLLFCVSLFLTAVRIRLRSVLASTLVHASYNFAVFLTEFIATGGYRHLDKLNH